MTEHSFKDQIRERIQRERLNDDEFDGMQSLIREHSGRSPERHRHRRLSRRSFLTGMATAAAVGAVGVAGWQWLGQEPVTIDTLADEVLRNHRWLKPLDLTTARFDQLSRYFTQGLDFAPQASDQLPAQDLVLEGGRFCTLGGIKAAQIVFRDNDGQLLTFYQTRYDADKLPALPHRERNESPLALTRNDHDIRIWVEDGIVMAFAQQQESERNG